MDVDIEALGGQGNLFERGAFLIVLGGGGLGLMLSLGGVVRDAFDGLFLLVAGGKTEAQQACQDQN